MTQDFISNSLARVWRRETFSITLASPRPVRDRVDGITCSEAPGLGLHIGKAHRSVDVTHLASGLRVSTFHSLGSAMEFVHIIASVRDWTVETPPTKAEWDTVLDVRGRL